MGTQGSRIDKDLTKSATSQCPQGCSSGKLNSFLTAWIGGEVSSSNRKRSTNIEEQENRQRFLLVSSSDLRRLGPVDESDRRRVLGY